MVYGFFIVIHVLVCILLVVVIMMQRSKGGGLAGIAGGAASQAMLGGRGAATLIHKITIGLAVAFSVGCLFLGILSKDVGGVKSVTQENMDQEAYPLDFLNESTEMAPAETAPATAPIDLSGTEETKSE